MSESVVSKLININISWNLCRVCLKGGELSSIYENVNETNLTYREIMELCTGIEIKMEANLPQLICRKCMAYSNIAYKFRALCLSSNTTLESFLKSKLVDNELMVSFEEANRSHSPSPKKELTKNSQPSTSKPRSPSPHVDHYYSPSPVDLGPSPSPVDHRSPSPVDHRSPSPVDHRTPPECSTKNGNNAERQNSANLRRPSTRKMPHYNYRKIIVNFKKSSKIEDINENENIKHNPDKTKNNSNIKGNDLLERCSSLNQDKNEYYSTNKRRKQKQSQKNSFGEMCDICGNIFSGKVALENHIRSHSFKKRDYTCEICGRCFATNSSQLTRHMRTHTGEKPYSCKYCDRKFSDPGSRSKHLRTHTGEKPFQCQICGKTFAYSHVLTKHQLVHTGVKDFECLPCEKKFATAHHLKEHYKTFKHKSNANSSSTQIVPKTEEDHKSNDQIYQQMINELIIQGD